MNIPFKTGQINNKVVCEALWAAALVCLPITTFPLFSSLTGALVAPLSILPIFILFLIAGLPLILRKGDLPKESIPLAVFTLVAILACAVAYFIYIPGFKGKSVPGQEIRALFTLAVGLLFFLVTTTWVRDTDRLKLSLKYITIGGMISLAWTAFQAIYVLKQAESYPLWLSQIQSWLVVRSPSLSPKLGRVNGLTYEASWFAHQMVMLYLPLWMAATYHKTSAFTFRIFRISVENILLVLGLGAFFLSSPRIGLVSFFLMVIYFFVRLNVAFYRKIVEDISKRLHTLKKTASLPNITSIRLFTSLFFVLIYILILAGVFLLASQRDWRLSLLISNPPTMEEIIGVITLDQNVLLDLSHRFIFLERMVYWFNGWNVFNQYPWLGVGLGNAGFFFPQLAPAIGWSSFEIRNVLYYLFDLPNVKSFWFRLLAETGVIGFSIFITWFYILFQSSRFSQHRNNVYLKTFALAGQLALLAFIGEGFSIDSFAMPYFWIMAGLISSAAMISRRDYSRLQSLAGEGNSLEKDVSP
jgi:hypothetical protein